MMHRSFFQRGPWIVFLLFTGTLISAFDRGSISTAGPQIMKDLKIDPAAFGVVLSSFFWAYLAMNIPAGLVADRIGPRMTLGLSALVYSMFTAATGLRRASRICSSSASALGPVKQRPSRATRKSFAITSPPSSAVRRWGGTSRASDWALRSRRS